MFVANAASQNTQVAPGVADSARHKASQCIVWLDKIGFTWRDASRYSRILMNLEDCWRDRPSTVRSLQTDLSRPVANHSEPMKTPGSSSAAEAAGSSASQNSGDLHFWNELPISLDLDHWNTFTNSYLLQSGSQDLGSSTLGPLPA